MEQSVTTTDGLSAGGHYPSLTEGAACRCPIHSSSISSNAGPAFLGVQCSGKIDLRNGRQKKSLCTILSMAIPIPQPAPQHVLSETTMFQWDKQTLRADIIL